MTAPQFEALADDAWLLRFGDRIDVALNTRVHAVAARLRRRKPSWLRDLVPAYASLGVFFDPAADSERVREQLEALLAADGDDAAEYTPRTIDIPVIYGGDHGPDLVDSAAELGLSPTQLIQRHSAAVYTVAMIGFAPGFPYLIGLDPTLSLPRLATPRARVPAGSIAIGGAQTGIYPRESPGGWRLIGRTAQSLFDPQREPPTLLQAGDRVRFVVTGGEQ